MINNMYVSIDQFKLLMITIIADILANKFIYQRLIEQITRKGIERIKSII